MSDKQFDEITGNKTLRQFWEDEYYKLYDVGPDRGMFFADKQLVHLGPYYLTIFYGKQYSMAHDQQMLVSVSQ